MSSVGAGSTLVRPRTTEPRALPRCERISSDPLTSIVAARANLFDGATCIVTPTEETDAGALKMVHEFWKALGCNVRTLMPLEHDEIVAQISHLPHLVALAGHAERACLHRFADRQTRAQGAHRHSVLFARTGHARERQAHVGTEPVYKSNRDELVAEQEGREHAPKDVLGCLLADRPRKIALLCMPVQPFHDAEQETAQDGVEIGRAHV